MNFFHLSKDLLRVECGLYVRTWALDITCEEAGMKDDC